jgi:hypothetical protein
MAALDAVCDAKGPQEVAELYNRWAETYDADMARQAIAIRRSAWRCCRAARRYCLTPEQAPD